jgi:hypothetical protein
VAKYVDWIADVMGVDGSESLATPKTSDEPVNSTTSFLLKKSDNILFSITVIHLSAHSIFFYKRYAHTCRTREE